MCVIVTVLVLTSAFLCNVLLSLPDVYFFLHHQTTPHNHSLPSPSPFTLATSCEHTANHQERLTWTLKSWAENRHGHTLTFISDHMNLKGIVITRDVENLLILQTTNFVIPLNKLVLLKFINKHTVSPACYQTEHRVNHDVPFVVQNQ